MNNTLEKEIERSLKRVVEGRLGGKCLKWVCPGWSGVPDRILLLPGGVVHFVETKRPQGGKVDPMQAWWKRQLEGLGFRVWHVHNLQELDYLALILTDELARKGV